MEKLIKELDNYVKGLDKDLKVSYWDDSISLDYKGHPMLYAGLIQERFTVCGELLEDAFESDNEVNKQIDLIRHFKYVEPFVEKFIELFNSRDKYVYYYNIAGLDYYLCYGNPYDENNFENSYFGIVDYIRPRFFENDTRLKCLPSNNFIKMKDNSSFGNNQGEWTDTEFTEREKVLLTKILFQ